MRKSARKTIAILSNTSWSIYNFRRGLVRRLAKEGYQVLILCPQDRYTEKLKNEPCQFIPVKLSRHKVNPIPDLQYSFEVFRILRRHRPDFLISYTVKPNIYGQFAARLLRIPRLAVVTGLGYLFIRRNWKTVLVKWLYKHSFKGAKKVWFLNKDDQSCFLTEGVVSPAQAAYLPGEGVDTGYFKPNPVRPATSSALCFVYAGRLIKEKGVPEFVQAAQILKPSYPEVEFQIAGFLEKDAPGAISAADIVTWEKTGAVNYQGAKEDIRPILAEAHCVVLPTYYREGVPRILLEAASMGIPIIGTPTPGCKDIVLEGKTGFLCQPMDHKQLGRVMEKVIRMDDTQRHQLGIEGRKIVRAYFQEEIIINRYLHFLQQLFGATAEPKDKATLKFN
ncbi:glycosyltransferase family 4 protein [Phaeodactylibacter xiamenensis]|jgi:glycosyltransferase involved in cell wall biosynthesis|uniref:glycosyltransferase family 4 protein n=1 Tax=Phaeodactylibacter xiamenensis TaxID=1524460 RepID=UPI0005C68192|nr:glycosyltransferase family 4 protein [Phaeodactylibacter xiamenensis]MCR9052124.1 glycosyltransferase family 4 protein [bacterium]